MRQYALVRIKKEMEVIYENHFGEGPFIYFGEIPNMKGHGIFMDHITKKIYSGMHIDTFEEIPEDEC